VEELGILIIDDDEFSQAALRQILDSEGWRVRVAPLVSQGLAELSSGTWTLAIVNVALTDLDGPAFATFKELGQSDVAAPGRKRLRVLFLVPTLVASQAQPLLERERLPYVLKPFHLHDFLEKISDLLLEAQAISKPIRQMQAEPLASERRQKERRSGKDRRPSAMFASRADYQMTEEEIAEFEKQEQEEVERKKRSKREKEQQRP
jgi:DNA-binding response OmpR family regulator